MVRSFYEKYFHFLNRNRKLGNEPVASASLPISFLLAPRLNILITDTGTDIGDLIGAEKKLETAREAKNKHWIIAEICVIFEQVIIAEH